MDEQLKKKLLARLSDGRASGFPNPDVCWEWQGPLSSGGYGSWWADGRTWRSHRLTWTIFRGPIPEGLVIDHLCRNRACCNPDHLRVVTQRTNSLENSEGVSAVMHRRTECQYGHGALLPHPYVPGKRVCHTCYYASSRNNQRKRRAEYLSGERENLAPLVPPREMCRKGLHRLVDDEGNPTSDLLVRSDGRRECRGCHRERERNRRRKLAAERKRLSGDSILRSP